MTWPKPRQAEHGWDVIGIVDIKTGLLRRHPGTDFIDARCGLNCWDIEFSDDIRLAPKMTRNLYPRWAIGVHPVATEMRQVCFVLLVMPLLALGILAGLLIPPPDTPGPADGLWQHTCFEAFVARTGEPAYQEFNFSPSGQWAAYRFSAERVRDLPAEAAAAPFAPELVFVEQPQSLDLQIWLPREALPPAAAGAPLILGLNAVLETRDGQLSYWALHHPTARPDFHHRAGFAHVLDLPPFPTAPFNPA